MSKKRLRGGATGLGLLLALAACGERPSEALGEQAQAQTLSVKVPGFNIDLEGSNVQVFPANPPLQLNDSDALQTPWASLLTLRFALEGSSVGPLYAANKPYVSTSLAKAGARSLSPAHPSASA